MNLRNSTRLTEDTGVPFDELQAEQIAIYRAAWPKAGWGREPRVSVSRSILPIVNNTDRAYFGHLADEDQEDQVGYLDGGAARFGKSYVGRPDAIADTLARDAAVRDADTLLLTMPNQLGVAYNATCSRRSPATLRPRSAGARDHAPRRLHNRFLQNIASGERSNTVNRSFRPTRESNEQF